jgi:hypothetical protein
LNNAFIPFGFAGVYYYCYEAVKAAFEKAKAKDKGMSMTTLESMAAGAIAGAAVVFATNPIWTINVSEATTPMYCYTCIN